MKLRQAVLLVGGRGTRMWPLTATVPKGLLPVAGVPFLDFQIRQLTGAGIEEVFLAVGRSHLDAWEAFAAARPGVDLVVEDQPLDTAGPVRSTLDRLDERFLVLNGDVVLEADLGGYLGAVTSEAAGTLALVEVDDTAPYGVVVIDDSGRVERFVEKPNVDEAPAKTVNAGMYVIARSALTGYADGPLSFERVVFPDLVEAGLLAGVVVKGQWLDIGTPTMYLECTGAMLAGATALYSTSESHLVSGVCAGELRGSWNWVGAGASIGSGAVVEESVILPGANIGSGAVVRDSVVGWDAVVGRGSVVVGGAVIGAGAQIGPDNELDRGVRIGPGARLGAGAVTFSPPQ